MTPAEIQHRLQSWYGWESAAVRSGGGTIQDWNCTRNSMFLSPPDYLNDLNATRELESIIPDAKWAEYEGALLVAVGWKPGDSMSRAKQTAKSHHRVKAILKILGLEK